MPEFQIATTFAEAEAQDVRVPEHHSDWSEFALSLNGYQVSEDMGRGSVHDWVPGIIRTWEETGGWQHVPTVTELRIVLFYEARGQRFSGYTEQFPSFEIADSLLHEIAERLGQHYDDPEARMAYKWRRFTYTKNDMPRIPTCWTCKHWGLRNGMEVWKCKAFPDGIPDGIYNNLDERHRTPYPGDNGIQWEPYTPEVADAP